MRHATALGIAVVLAACTGSPEDFREIRDGQRQIMAKLNDLEKKIEQAAARPAAAPPPARPPVDPNAVFNIAAGDSPFKGAAAAPVLLVEFSDFQCPFCAQLTPLFDQVLQAFPGQVKLVYKQLPLAKIHPHAMGAARASLAAHRQGKFWEMHDLLFANQRALQAEKLKEYAQRIGLDLERFERDMNSPEVQKQIDEDMKAAWEARVTGTPTLFVNGKRANSRSLEGMRQMIEEALKERRRGPPQAAAGPPQVR